MKKIFATFFFLFAALFPAALANVPIPLSVATIPLFPIIVAIEFFVFYLMINKIYKGTLKWTKILFTVGVANVATSLVGTFLLANFFPNIFSFLLTAFILSVLIEWGVYIFLLRKENLKKEQLLKISLCAHVASYLIESFE